MRPAPFVAVSVLCAACTVATPAHAQLGSARRAHRVVQAFADGRVVHRCWTELLALAPQEPVRVQITLWVNARGRFTRVAVGNSPDPRFSACLRRGVRALPPVDPGTRGEPIAAELSVHLAPADR